MSATNTVQLYSIFGMAVYIYILLAAITPHLPPRASTQTTCRSPTQNRDTP